MVGEGFLVRLVDASCSSLGGCAGRGLRARGLRDIVVEVDPHLELVPDRLPAALLDDPAKDRLVALDETAHSLGPLLAREPLGLLEQRLRGAGVERPDVHREAAAVVGVDVEVADRELPSRTARRIESFGRVNQLRTSSSLSSGSPNAACGMLLEQSPDPRCFLDRRRADLERHASSSRVSASRERSVQLARRLRARGLAEPVDPDRRQAELVRRSDVVEEAGGDVDVRWTADPLLERAPVAERGLVRADLRRDDRLLERDADPFHRRVDVVAVGVREDRELPAALTRLLERRRHLRERPPAGRRPASAPPPRRARRAAASPRSGPRGSGATHPPRARLDDVVARERPSASLLAEDARELTADPAVPVDQRAVAIEGRPPVLSHGCERSRDAACG